MALRKLTRTDHHFLVRYLEDSKVQVRSKGHFKDVTDEILVGSSYQVQWGNGRQVTQAVVLATGSQKEMKARETEDAQNPSVDVAAPAAQSTKPPVKRPRVQKKEKGKELARMVAVGQGQVAAPIGSVGVPAPVAVALPATVLPIVPAPTTPSVEVPVAVAPSLPVTAPAPSIPAPTTPSGPSVEVPVAVLLSAGHGIAPPDSTTLSVPVSEELPGTTPTIRRPTFRNQRQSDDTVAAVLTGVQAMLVARNTKFSKQYDTLAITVQDLHSEVRDLRLQVDALLTLYHRAVSSEPSPPQETVVDLSQLGLPEEEVRRIHGESNNAGHFACKLVRKVFPELFGPGNLRSLYNWNGNGQKKKLALDEPRREAIRSAVLGYHPEVRGPGPFQDRVIIKVNEMLRRNDKRSLANRQLNIDTPLLDGFMNYMNSDNM